MKSSIKSALSVFLVLAVVPVGITQPASVPTNVAKATVDMSIYGHVAQVGWVVRDLDPVINYWEKLGLKNIRRIASEKYVTVTYRGREVPISLKIAFGDIGGVEIEWIQPIKGRSLYDEFLEKHTGGGVHHLTYGVKSSEQLAEEVRYFKSRGVKVVQSGSWKGTDGEGLFADLDTVPNGGGLTIELMYNPDRRGATMTSSSSNEYPLNKIVHYAFVVRDVRKVGEFYATLGLGGMPVKDNVSSDRFYNGQSGMFEERLGWWAQGEVPFEWIQPLVGPSVEDEYLKVHGEGFHHFAFNVADMDQAIKLFESKGVHVSQSGRWNKLQSQGRWAYLGTQSCGGVTIELIWNRPQ